jgi:hypothetical protein
MKIVILNAAKAEHLICVFITGEQENQRRPNDGQKKM